MRREPQHVGRCASLLDPRVKLLQQAYVARQRRLVDPAEHTPSVVGPGSEIETHEAIRRLLSHACDDRAIILNPRIWALGVIGHVLLQDQLATPA